jgi:hypothetical protein
MLVGTEVEFQQHWIPQLERIAEFCAPMGDCCVELKGCGGKAPEPEIYLTFGNIKPPEGELTPNIFEFTGGPGSGELSNLSALKNESYRMKYVGTVKATVLTSIGGPIFNAGGFVEDFDADPDDDSPVSQITIRNTATVEGRPATFRLSLPAASSLPIVVQLTASSLTATASVDFAITNFQYSTDDGINWIPGGGSLGTTVTVPSGNTSILIRVGTVNDLPYEGDEFFRLSGEVLSGTTDSITPGTGRIIDDDDFSLVYMLADAIPIGASDFSTTVYSQFKSATGPGSPTSSSLEYTTKATAYNTTTNTKTDGGAPVIVAADFTAPITLPSCNGNGGMVIVQLNNDDLDYQHALYDDSFVEPVGPSLLLLSPTQYVWTRDCDLVCISYTQTCAANLWSTATNQTGPLSLVGYEAENLYPSIGGVTTSGDVGYQWTDGVTFSAPPYDAMLIGPDASADVDVGPCARHDCAAWTTINPIVGSFSWSFTSTYSGVPAYTRSGTGTYSVFSSGPATSVEIFKQIYLYFRCYQGERWIHVYFETYLVTREAGTMHESYSATESVPQLPDPNYTVDRIRSVKIKHATTRTWAYRNFAGVYNQSNWAGDWPYVTIADTAYTPTVYITVSL